MCEKLNNDNKFHLMVPAIIGIGIWLVFYRINNLTDPQSYDNYWQIGYPIFIGTAFFTSIISEIHPVVFGLVIGSVQIVLGLLFLKGDLSQLPFGLIFHFFIVIPIVIGGYLGRLVRSIINKMQHHKK